MISGQGDERVSNSFASRIRHAFLKWDYAPGKNLLAGQYWSTFFNVAAPAVIQHHLSLGFGAEVATGVDLSLAYYRAFESEARRRGVSVRMPSSTSPMLE